MDWGRLDEKPNLPSGSIFGYQCNKKKGVALLINKGILKVAATKSEVIHLQTGWRVLKGIVWWFLKWRSPIVSIALIDINYDVNHRERSVEKKRDVLLKARLMVSQTKACSDLGPLSKSFLQKSY